MTALVDPVTGLPMVMHSRVRQALLEAGWTPPADEIEEKPSSAVCPIHGEDCEAWK